MEEERGGGREERVAGGNGGEREVTEDSVARATVAGADLGADSNCCRTGEAYTEVGSSLSVEVSQDRLLSWLYCCPGTGRDTSCSSVERDRLGQETLAVFLCPDSGGSGQVMLS